MKRFCIVALGLVFSAILTGCCCSPCCGSGFGGGGCGPGGCGVPSGIPATGYYQPPCNGSCGY
ncbi:MAG: hypothetical protein ACKV0T_18870 [Planctomycetales bacterium]